MPTLLRVELCPQPQALFIGLPAEQLRVDRPLEGAHAIEPFGRGARRQPVEVTVGTCDVAVRAGGDVDDDVSALRHEHRSPCANRTELSHRPITSIRALCHWPEDESLPSGAAVSFPRVWRTRSRRHTVGAVP